MFVLYYSIVANVLWTPFHHVNIPPPMCAHQLTVPSAVLAIAYSPPPRSNDFVILTSKGFIVFVKSENCTEQVEGMRSGFRSMTVTPIVQAVSHRYVYIYMDKHTLFCIILY